MRTLLISLGGARYSRSPSLRHAAFKPSSQAVAHALTSADHGVVAIDDHLDLFDDDRSWPEQVIHIRDWIRAASARERIENLLVHHVGHGSFKRNSEEHYLSINSTDEEEAAVTSATLGALNDAIIRAAPSCRRFYIIDACFAAASVRDLMAVDGGAELERRVGSLLNAWPSTGNGATGVAALCSADKLTPASARGQRDLTQFTDALLAVLETGDQAAGGLLSLRRAHELIRPVLLSRYGEEAVHPVLVAPEDASGGIAAVPLLPNLAAPPGAAASAVLGSAAVSIANGAEEVQSLAPDAAPCNHGPVAPRAPDALEEALLDRDQRFRQVVYRFFKLPASRRRELVARLGHGAGTEDGSSELDRQKAALARVREGGAVKRLENLLVQAEALK